MPIAIVYLLSSRASGRYHQLDFVYVRQLILAAVLCASFASAQTTQGLIAGRILNSRTGRPVAGAVVFYNSREGTIRNQQTTGADGYFTLPLLSPGFYHLRIEADRYQPQEVAQVELAVAGRLDFAFLLRPLADLWEAGEFDSVFLPGSKTIVTFFGPDVDATKTGSFEAPRGSESPLDSSLSTVVDRQLINNLPLDGRDVYSLLALQPGVTANSTTGRGLGLSVVGGRLSASNFLLDGVENNNSILTGPLQPLVPEAVEEYRISENNYSAEFGRTSGFIANAITRSAGTRWHVTLYEYERSDALDANGWFQNATALPREPLKEIEPGVVIGGPIWKNRWFVSGAFELNRYRTKSDPESLEVPTTGFVAQITGLTAKTLFQQFAPPAADLRDMVTNVTYRPPVVVNGLLATPRSDYLRRDGADRFLLRAAVSRDNQPDFAWTPYPAFVTPLTQGANSGAAAWLRSFNPSLTHEARVGFSTDQLGFIRPHPEIPYLSVNGGIAIPGGTLPANPETYSLEDRGRTLELVDNVIWTRGRHVITFGGGFLLRYLSGSVTSDQNGVINFNSLAGLASDTVNGFQIARTRQDPTLNASPDYDRQYRYGQYFLFAQDSFRLSPRLTVNLGLRYENLGAPVNIGAHKDALVALGPGNSFVERIASAGIVYPGPGNEPLYANDNRDFAVRGGFGYNLRRDSKIVLRGGFGMFYDRPFDNLWLTMQANNLLVAKSVSPQNIQFQLPALQAAASIVLRTAPAFDPTAQPLTVFQGSLRNGYAENGFLGLEHRISDHFSLQTNGVTSLGRELLTSDIVNRPLSVMPAQQGNPSSNANPSLPFITYRGNQGSSDYFGGQLVARYRSPRLQAQLSYTLSHSIDNQSEPLAAAFLNFDLSFNSAGTPAAFTRQFDSHADRASSDFDQRHNAVAYAVWEAPPWFTATRAAPIFRDWAFGLVAAFRSGFPYSVLAPYTFSGFGQYYFNDRANLLSGVPVFLNAAVPGMGGIQVLNPAAFSAPPAGGIGDTGRNAFRGPGLYSTDISISRRFPVARLGEASRLTIRADAFNVLNHANLNTPNNVLCSCSGFGVAQYGLQVPDSSGFPSATPFQESPRVIQLGVRLEFE
jgi:hypothetical protein